jgi:hypothetical protein
MGRLYNGMPAGQLPLAWVRTRRSSPNGNCVEMAALPDAAGVAVRNSRDPQGPALIYTVAEVEAFLLGVRDGEFDHLLS